MEKFEQHGKILEEDLSFLTVAKGLYRVLQDRLGGRRSSQPVDPPEFRAFPPVCGPIYRTEEGPPSQHPEQGKLF